MNTAQRLVAPLLAAVLAAPCTAQDERPLADSEEPWTIKFEPAAWYAAPSGSIGLPGNAGSGNGRTHEVAELNLDSARVSPLGEFQLRRGPWRVSLSGMAFSIDGRGVTATGSGQIGAAAYVAGDAIESGFDTYSFAAMGGYELHRYESGELQHGGARVRSTVVVLGGVRAVSADADVVVRSGGTTPVITTASGDALHAHPAAGLRWELEIFEDFSIDLVGTIGGLTTGDTESWSGDILVGFQWNPTRNFGAQVGYRQVLLGVEDGAAPTEFSWQGGLAGLYAGATLRF